MKFMPVTDFPLSLTVQADFTVMLATLVISVLTGVIFGILPAPVLERGADCGVEGGHGKRVRWTQEGAPRERAGSGPNFPLAAALDLRGIVIRSVQSAQQIDPGFNSHNVWVASYDLFAAGYRMRPGRNSIARSSRNWKRCRA